MELTVRIDSGALAGVAGNNAGVAVFKGIPYASPPTGELRWRPPQPPACWEGVRQADRFGPICPQFIPAPGTFYYEEFYLEEQEQSEDCLYLNVWSAAADAAERRPVMVWFHGGGLVEGSGSLPSFDGEALALHGVVLVTVNYRLSVLGFMAHPELTAESEHGSSGNYGMLDQIEALRWVQRNIAAFGGDPGNVTIFGQSAGCFSVYSKLASPLAKGLFHKAICQSIFLGPLGKLQEAEACGLRFAEARGAASIAELRSQSHEELMSDPELYRGALGLLPVTVDGWVHEEDPFYMMLEGRHHDVPLILGATSDEMTTLAAFDCTLAAYEAMAHRQFGEEAERFLSLYPATTDSEATVAYRDYLGDKFLASKVIWARARQHAGQSESYLYYFTRRPPGRNDAFYGAFHSADLYYVFRTLGSTERPWEASDERLADAMSGYWAGFAATGAPQAEGLPAWPAFDEHDVRVMELGEEVAATALPHAGRISFCIGRILQRDPISFKVDEV